MAKETWLEKTNRRISNIESHMNEKTKSRFFMSNLKKAVIRIDQFSDRGCEECEEYKDIVDQLIIEMTYYNNKSKKFRKTNYMSKMGKLMDHMRKKHELVPAGKYDSNAMNIGALVAAVLGILTANVVVPAIILAFAKFSGFVFEKHAKMTGRHL